MQKLFFVVICFLLLAVFLTHGAFAQDFKTLVINEIAYRGTIASATDEWIELFNVSDAPIELSGWKLLIGDTVIELKGVVPQKEFYLLERTNDLTVSDVLADQIYTGAMKDEGTMIFLKNPAGNVVDQVSKWFVRIDRQTMERVDPFRSGDDPSAWAMNDQKTMNGKDAKGNPIMGTPKSKNSVFLEPRTVSVPEVHVRISRVFPNPEGNDEGREWIELENMDDRESSMDGFLLDNRDGSSQPYVFSKVFLLPRTAKQFFSKDTGIELRNSGDQVRLFAPDGRLVDQVEWKNDIRDGVILERKTLLAESVRDMVMVSKVIDGDTLVVKFEDGKTITVRMIGIDSPETVHPTKAPEPFGKEASDFLKTEIFDKTVFLEYDNNRLDEYGRLLAYVFLDNQHMNAKLIEKGFARAYVRYPFKYQELFLRLEERAKASGTGMWFKPPPTPPPQQQLVEPKEEPVPTPSFLSLVLKKLNEWLRQIYSTFAPGVAPQNSP